MGEEKKSVSENVSSFCDGYWQRYERNDPPPYDITGKYLFFSPDRTHLVEIAIAALECGGFHHAKIQMEGKNFSDEYVLCLYYKDDTRKHELAKRYRNYEGVKYRYWKSDEATRKGEYSEKFLRGLPPAARRVFKQGDDENEETVPIPLEYYAGRAEEELRRSNEWIPNDEEDRVNYFCNCQKLPPFRSVILYILRGEAPQGILVFFEAIPGINKSIARANIEEVKKQIREFFQDEEHRYEWPDAFGIPELLGKYPRVYDDWSPEERACLAMLAANGNEVSALAHLFQRPQKHIRAALSTQPETITDTISKDSALLLLGSAVQCASCFHRGMVTYNSLDRIAHDASVPVWTVSKEVLLETINRRGVCGQCKKRTMVLG